MSNFHRNHGNNDSEESIRKYAKGGTGEFTVGNMLGGCEFRRHDELLHVSPGEVRCLEPAEAEEELERLHEKFGVVVKHGFEHVSRRLF